MGRGCQAGAVILKPLQDFVATRTEFSQASVDFRQVFDREAEGFGVYAGLIEARLEQNLQLQHNMWVTASRTAVLSIITGGGKWVEMTIPADPLYQHLLLTAERKFWRCVQNGEPPRLFGIEPPRPRVEAIRTVDMSGSNAWAEFANLYRLTRPAALDHDWAKVELKALVPEDAREAAGHGVRAKRSKSGAISFEVLELEASHAALQR